MTAGPDASAGPALPARPRPGDRRRAPEPLPTGPVAAVAGAALAVLSVALGIVVVNWVAPAPDLSTVVTESAARHRVLEPPLPRPSPGAGGAGADVLGGARAAVPTPTPTPTPTAVPSASPRPPSLVLPVTVLNNSRRTGLAARAAARFRAGGWPVALTGNFRGRIPVTTVYYDPGLEQSARAFARTFDGVVRVRPRFAGLPARGVVVVVTREFPA